MQSKQELTRGYLFQGLSIITSVFSVLANKLSLSGLPASVVGLWGAIVLLILQLSFARKVLKNIKFSVLKYALPSGAIHAIGTLLLYISLKHLTPMTVSFLGRFYIVFCSILGMILLKERFLKRELFLFFLCFVGTVMYFIKGAMEMQSGYILLCLASSLMFALSFTMTRIQKTKISTHDMLFYRSLISIMLFIPYAVFCSEMVMPEVNDLIWVSISTVFFLVSTVSFFYGLNFMAFTRANVLRTFIPVLVTIISYPFFPETLSLLNVSGAALIFFSCLALTYIEIDKISKLAEKKP